ncbi:MAG TPA: hypothetical protein VK631_03385, partial [Solirubrobacteraceae bacterium]|nr:hypothetical protein [Solirubrobacteraceae bacterium]
GGEVVELDPSKLLVYTWGDEAPRRSGPAPPGRVTAAEPGRALAFDAVRWTLEPRLPGSLVVVEETLPELRPGALAAWQVHLELLVAGLQGSERCWPDERVAALEARYAARLYSSRSVWPPSTTSETPVT